MRYLTYEEYTGMGGTLQESAFNRYELQARKLYIDRATFNRLASAVQLPEIVKLCAFELIGKINEETTRKARNVQSESNDGVSVTYKVADDAAFRTECLQLVNAYLEEYKMDDGTPLTYRGITNNDNLRVISELLSTAQVEKLINRIETLEPPEGHEILYVEADS